MPNDIRDYLPASVIEFDRYTSPTHNPLLICFAFNFVILSLLLTLAFLIHLGERSVFLYGFIGLTILLALIVNYVLVYIAQEVGIQSNTSSIPVTTPAESKKNE